MCLVALDSLIWTQKDKLRSYMKWFNWLIRTPGHPAKNRDNQTRLIRWPFDGAERKQRGPHKTERDKRKEEERKGNNWGKYECPERGYTSCPSVGLTGEAEEAVGEDEVDDGDEGEVTLGLTSASFFSFRSTCLLFGPEGNQRIISAMCICIKKNQEE